MIKKKQVNSSKRTSIEKDSVHNIVSQRKSRETVKVESSKDKAKTKKDEKGSRPILQQRSKSKGNLQENIRQPKKTAYQVDQILMKKDLKQLLSKKGIRKSKDANIVPDILKKIEQNCRILKKIDYLQHHPSQKKVGKQSVSNSKSFKYSHCNNRSQMPTNKSRIKSKQMTQEPAKVMKKSRRSHQISSEHKIEDKIQRKVSSKTRHGSKISKMIQVVQQYKKVIDREQIRVQKSSKNTNYNSNQSRNSSSLHNSHGLFNILESMSKNHKFQESSANMDKIQGLIKQQQSNIELSNSQKHVFEAQNPQKQIILQESQIQKKRQLQIIEQQSYKKDDQNILNKKFEIFNEKSNRSSIKFDSSSLNNALWEKDNQRSNRPFQKSKYYVQPIPPFRGKKSQEDNSLLGCEIPLMENNIINDSELPELQL